MADAKICDRCGEYYPDNSGNDACQIPISDAEDVYVTPDRTVSVQVTEDDLESGLPSRAPRIDPVATGQRFTSKQATVETKDLCESCRDEFRDFWNNGGDA